jgi:hypothetical protein
MNYSDSAFPPDSLSYFEALAFMHGGFVGLNEAHFEVLAQLAMRAHMTCRGIVLGIERDEYLQTKGRDTLRPWPLIVTVSLYAHLAKIYRIPLRIFIMPVPPRSSAEYNTHYNAIYKQILKKNPKTTLVTTPRDPFRKKKYQRMKAVGLTPYDWEWTDIDFILSASTGVILGDREKIYRSLFPRLESQDFLTHFLSLKYWKTLRALY